MARVNLSEKEKNLLLPPDMLSDLNDAYKFYDGETEGYVTMPHFRNIL